MLSKREIRIVSKDAVPASLPINCMYFNSNSISPKSLVKKTD